MIKGEMIFEVDTEDEYIDVVARMSTFTRHDKVTVYGPGRKVRVIKNRTPKEKPNMWKIEYGPVPLFDKEYVFEDTSWMDKVITAEINTTLEKSKIDALISKIFKGPVA